jgi:hypothetical protein
MNYEPMTFAVDMKFTHARNGAAVIKTAGSSLYTSFNPFTTSSYQICDSSIYYHITGNFIPSAGLIRQSTNRYFCLFANEYFTPINKLVNVVLNILCSHFPQNATRQTRCCHELEGWTLHWAIRQTAGAVWTVRRTAPCSHRTCVPLCTCNVILLQQSTARGASSRQQAPTVLNPCARIPPVTKHFTSTRNESVARDQRGTGD